MPYNNYSNPVINTSEVNPLDKIEERIKSGQSRSIPVDMDRLDRLMKGPYLGAITQLERPAQKITIEEVQKNINESLKRLDELRAAINADPDLLGTKLLLANTDQVEGVIRQVERLMEISNKEAEKKGMTLDEYLKS